MKLLLLLFIFASSYPRERAIVTKVKDYQCWAQHTRDRYYYVFDCRVQYKVGDTVSIVGWKRY